MTEKELCFCIEGSKLYLEKILVDYEGIPIFFLCKSAERYYAALCTDVKVFQYIVVPVTGADVNSLLQGIIPMRDIFTKCEEYWEIAIGREAVLDNVTRHRMEDLDCSMLPEEGAVFQDFRQG